MNRPVFQVLSDINQEGLYFFLRPVVYASERGHGEALNTRRHILVIPHAQFLILGIPSPCVRGPFVALDCNINESNLSHHFCKRFNVLVGSSKLDRCIINQVDTSRDSMLRLQGTIVGLDKHIVLLQLEETARFEIAANG